MIKNSFLLFIIIQLNCAEVLTSDSRLEFKKDKLYFQGKLFSGKLISYFDSGILRYKAEYNEGLKNGEEYFYFPNGKLSAIRKYLNDQKEGIHLGFHENEKIRFYFQFHKDKFINENYIWYPNQKLESFMKYSKEGELISHKIWREDGKIYSNTIIYKNRKIGVSGAKLCKKIENQKDISINY